MVGLHKLINHTKIFHLPAGLGTKMLIAVFFQNGYPAQITGNIKDRALY